MFVSLLAAAAVAVADDSGQRLADLQLIYSQSCESRAYGSFDDLCDRLKRQMRTAERAQRDATRQRPPARATVRAEPLVVDTARPQD
jgi:hypothetical protein